jgi:hypothetical protein
MYEIINNWNEKYAMGIKISNDTKLCIILIADDEKPKSWLL